MKSDSSRLSTHECLDWLEKQGRDSVFFVSFGMTSFVSDEQIKELATGLEASEQKFLWVLRGRIKATSLPEKAGSLHCEGFEERVKKRGIVVRDWWRWMGSWEGGEIRRRAKELGVGVKKSGMKDWISSNEMHLFIANITQNGHGTKKIGFVSALLGGYCRKGEFGIVKNQTTSEQRIPCGKQRFDYPSDTILQGMDFGWNLVTGWERYISSWTSPDDPSPGSFTAHLDITRYPQIVIQ